MRKYFNFQISAAIFFSAFFVIIGYELKNFIDADSYAKSAIILFFSFALSSITTSAFSNFIIKVKFFRKYFYRGSWIEGYWYNVEFSSQSEPNLLNGPAITEITFKNPEIGFETTGYRRQNEIEVYTFSQQVVLMGDYNLYINFATSNSIGAFRNILACGYFYRSPGSSILDTYDGVILSTDGNISYRQRAKKIDDKTVRRLKKEFKENWIHEFLANIDKYVETPNKKTNDFLYNVSIYL